jgi:hypothetical protein
VLLLLSVAPFVFVIPSASPLVSPTTSTSMAYSNTFSIQGASGYPDKTCYYHAIELGTGWEGTKLYGSVAATNGISFGILNSVQYNQYITGPGWRGAICKFTAQSVLSPGTRITQYSFNWTVPNSDTYCFVFFNPNDVNVQITFDVWTIVVSTISSTSTRQSSTRLTPSTQASVTQGNQPAQQAQPSASNLPPVVLLVAAVIIIGIVIVGALVVSGRRAGKAQDRGVVRPEVTQMPRQVEEGTQFCINCGAKLPPKSKFCNKCGTAQT